MEPPIIFILRSCVYLLKKQKFKIVDGVFFDQEITTAGVQLFFGQQGSAFLRKKNKYGLKTEQISFTKYTKN